MIFMLVLLVGYFTESQQSQNLKNTFVFH